MNVCDLPENQKDGIISAGINLIHAISEAIGPEEGMKAWDIISEQLGNGVKETIFMSMLTGRTAGTVVLIGDVNYSNVAGRIDLIKCIRNYTGLGLKEAKDITDVLYSGQSKTIKMDWKNRNEFVLDLRRLGINVA